MSYNSRFHKVILKNILELNICSRIEYLNTTL